MKLYRSISSIRFWKGTRMFIVLIQMINNWYDTTQVVSQLTTIQKTSTPMTQRYCGQKRIPEYLSYKLL